MFYVFKIKVQKKIKIIVDQVKSESDWQVGISTMSVDLGLLSVCVFFSFFFFVGGGGVVIKGQCYACSKKKSGLKRSGD